MLNADKHSPASSARSTKRWVRGMLLSVGVESSHWQIAKRLRSWASSEADCECPLYIEVEEHINGIEDYYVRTAYAELIDKCKSFYKEIKIDLLKNFLDKNQCKIEEIIVYGHSCAIDFDYFSYLNTRYPNAYWKFYVRGAEQESNVWYLIEENSIKNADIIKV